MEYRGEFRDDKWNGYGELTMDGGRKYEGQFRDDENGTGRFTGKTARCCRGGVRR